MRKLALFVMFLSLCATAQAQQKQSLSAAATTCTATGTVCLIVGVDQTQGGATFTVTANASGNTIQFEASGDGATTWVALNVFPSNSTTAVTSTTGTGTWQANTAGYTNVRMRMSTLVGGTTTVNIIQSTASARAGGGGGGGGSGTVASCATTNAIAQYTGSTTIGCGNADFTIDGTAHTLLAGANGLVDLSAETTATGFKVPVGAGFTASANGVINYDSTAGNTHQRTAGADSLSVGEASAIANGFLPMSTSATNSLIAATLCDQGITTANTLTCTNSSGLKVVSVATGTSPPTCAIGTAGVHCMTEGTAPTGAASVDMVYANATNHCLDALNNNVDDGCLLNVTNGGTFPIPIVSGVSGGIPYFSSITAESASGLLTQYGVVFGGGAGNAPTVSAQGAANMPLIGQGAANPIFSTIAYPTTVTSGGVCYGSSTTAISCGAILNTNILVKGGGSGATPTNTSITDDAKNITTSEVVAAGNKVFVTADFTDSTSGSLVLITGLTWTLPTSKAANYSFHCELMFDQGTAAVVDEFGVGVTGTAPTNLSADGRVFASASGAWTTSGVLTGLASTTPTLVVSFTPSAITTVWTASLDGTIEQPSNATPGVFSIYAYTTTGSDNLIVKRGSYCSLF